MSTWTFMNIVKGLSDSTFSNLFSLGTAWSIEAKFYLKSPWDEGMKVNTNGLCHMTKMAAMPTYAKTLKKSSLLETKGRWPWNLVCGIGYSSTTKFLQLMTLGWLWSILQKGQIWSLWFLYDGTQVLPNLFKWWHWVDLDHFYDMVKFVSYCFCMGESLYSISSYISKLILIQHILCTQVSDTGPMVLWCLAHLSL